MSTPTEPGWYWARFAKADDPTESQPTRVRWFYLEPAFPGNWLCLEDERKVSDSGIEWGPKIPGPNELLTASEEHAFSEVSRLIEVDMDAAKARLEEMELQVEQRTGSIHPQCVYLSTYISMMEAGVADPPDEKDSA